MCKAHPSLSQKLFYFLGKPHLAWVSLFEVYRLQIHPPCAFERPEISHTAVCDQRLLALGTIGLFLKKETQKLLIGFIYKLRCAKHTHTLTRIYPPSPYPKVSRLFRNRLRFYKYPQEKHDKVLHA